MTDEKAVRAATDLKIISSDSFVKKYAIKYAWKAEQKCFEGNIDEETGEILDVWTGRFWGNSRSVRNDPEFYSEDIQDVRTFRRAMKALKGAKGFSGTWILWEEKLAEQLKRIGSRLARGKDVDEVSRILRDDKGGKDIFDRMILACKYVHSEKGEESARGILRQVMGSVTV